MTLTPTYERNVFVLRARPELETRRTSKTCVVRKKCKEKRGLRVEYGNGLQEKASSKEPRPSNTGFKYRFHLAAKLVTPCAIRQEDVSYFISTFRTTAFFPTIFSPTTALGLST